MMNIYRNEKGFTIVETIVVLAIIGVLVAIAIPLMHFIVSDTEKRVCQENLRVMSGALETWKACHPTSNYPSNEAVVSTLATDGLLKEEPSCPSGGMYSCEGGGSSSLPIISCSLKNDGDGGHHYP
jgi:prepilin-type N-terminal cleavage/methylation domain-containing protein